MQSLPDEHDAAEQARVQTSAPSPNEEAPDEVASFDGIRADLPHTLDLTAFFVRVEIRENEPPRTAGSATDIDRVPTPTTSPHAEAIGNPVDINPRVEGEASTQLIGPVDTPPPQLAHRPTSTHALVPGGPELLRDRFALLEIARYRLMSFRQLQAQVFGDLHKAVLTRRMQTLRRAGFLETWEDRLVLGGRPCYALPTQRGLAWALAELRAETQNTPHGKLVEAMIGETAKRPLVLAPRTAPPFLPHQDETNRVVAALEAIPALGITWASTWHRPFPNAIRQLAMPQPDAVLVATLAGSPHLVFLEHDRGQEAPASFARKKAERYSALALYGFTRELFGFEDFTVWVTVNDVAAGKPLARIRALQAVSTNAPMLRFTLAGWIPAHAHQQPIWFTPTTPVSVPERRPSAHAGLVAPFADPHDTRADARLRALLRGIPPRDDPHALSDDEFTPSAS